VAFIVRSSFVARAATSARLLPSGWRKLQIVAAGLAITILAPTPPAAPWIRTVWPVVR
jgi:hypothetical protein